MIINIPLVIKVTSILIYLMFMRTRTHVEALLSPFLAVNPVGLTERNSEPANGFYGDPGHILRLILYKKTYILYRGERILRLL